MVKYILVLFIGFLFIKGDSPEVMRSIKSIHDAEFSRIGDLDTYRAVPTKTIGMDQLDPFLFLNHHGPQIYKPGNKGLPFGPHPHKGFETVTFILKGDIVHKDTKGHESTITEGGVQWMTAGRGIVHSEVSSEEFKKRGGEIECLQLWINLPSALKQSEPNYIGLAKDAIPGFSLNEGKVTVNLISGNWGNKKGAIQSITGVMMSTIDFKAGAELSIETDTARTIFFYIIRGSLRVNGKDIQKHNLVEFGQDGESIAIKAATDGLIIFGHARPNKEPIAAAGPFVMNTMEEINEAYQEYYDGKFGVMK